MASPSCSAASGSWVTSSAGTLRRPTMTSRMSTWSSWRTATSRAERGSSSSSERGFACEAARERDTLPLTPRERSGPVAAARAHRHRPARATRGLQRDRRTSTTVGLTDGERRRCRARCDGGAAGRPGRPAPTRRSCVETWTRCSRSLTTRPVDRDRPRGRDGSRPAMRASVSDLPAPEGPNRTDRPDSTVKATSSSNAPSRRTTSTASAEVTRGSARAGRRRS